MKEKSRAWRRKSRYAKNFWPYLFIAPFFIVFGVFFIVPTFTSLYLSFTKWNGIAVPNFIGLKNYIDLLADPRFLKAVKNTFWAALVYNAIMINLALFLALILNSKIIKFRGFFRTVFFIPVTIALSVLAVVFSLIYAPQIGLLNLVLKSFGLPHDFAWLDDERLAMGSIIMIRIWRATGYYMVILLAGLTAIPEELYEAAKIDGASSLQQIFHITFPLLKPMVGFVIIISSIWSLQLFDEPWVLNKGGPNDATLTLLQYMYQTGFQFLKLGYSSAVSYILTMLIFIGTIFQLKFLRIQ